MVIPGMNKKNINLSKRIFLKTEKLEEALANEIISSLENDLILHNQAKLLLSGGNTPINLYILLSQFNINWAKVSIGLVDERFVSADDTYSNEKMIKNYLIQGKASKAKFIGLVYDIHDINKNVQIAIDKNKSFFEGTSCVLMGMGSDGHTASLFPNDESSSNGLQEKKNCKELIITYSPVKPTKRISYTKNQLLNTKRLFLYFTGEAKMKVFSQAKYLNHIKEVPISSFIHQNKKLLEVFWTF